MKNDKAAKIIEKAVKKGRKALSEYESKQLLCRLRYPHHQRKFSLKDKDGLARATERIGFPLVMKGCSADIAHKTEKRADPCGHTHRYGSEESLS